MKIESLKNTKNIKKNFFNWKDPFLLEDQLETDEKIIRNTAKNFSIEKLLPRISNQFVQSSPTLLLIVTNHNN